MLSESLAEQVGTFLTAGLGVMVLISGLKNTPIIADVFEKWPIIAVILNALLSLFGAWLLCLKMPGLDFAHCVIEALCIFLSAAGIHLVKKSLSPLPRDTPEIRADASRGSPVVAKKPKGKG